MDYRTITDTTSIQYAIVNNSHIQEGILYYEDYVCVALGSFYGEVGSKFKLTFDNGTQIKVIKSDEKSDKDVIGGCYHEQNNSMIEFIVDTQTLPVKALESGNMNALEKFKGSIIKIEKEK